MRTEQQPRFWCSGIALLCLALFAGASNCSAEDNYSTTLKKNRMQRYQDALLKGHVSVSQGQSGAGLRKQLVTSDFSNILSIGCACDAKIYIQCNPNQAELVKTDQPQNVHVSQDARRGTSISLNPWTQNIHLTVRTPELLDIGASGNAQWFLTAGNLRALRAGSSGHNTVTGTGKIDTIEFGSSGTNHLDGASFEVNDVIVGSSGTNSAVVAPRKSLYAHGVGTTRVKALSRPQYFEQWGSDTRVEFPK